MRFLPHKVGPSRAKHERRGRGSDAGSGGRGLENHAAERGGKPCSHPPASAQKGPRAEGRIVMGTRATRRAAALRARSVRPAGRKPDAGTPKHAERPQDCMPREPIERPFATHRGSPEARGGRLSPSATCKEGGPPSATWMAFLLQR